MKRRMAVLALAALVTLAAFSGQHQAGVTELVYATPYSPAHPFSRADLRWIAFVEEQSEGTLPIRPSWSGVALFRALPCSSCAMA